jgi:hypothetical protein
MAVTKSVITSALLDLIVANMDFVKNRGWRFLNMSRELPSIAHMSFSQTRSLINRMELAGDFKPSAFEEAPPLRSILWSTAMMATSIANIKVL